LIYFSSSFSSSSSSSLSSFSSFLLFLVFYREKGARRENIYRPSIVKESSFLQVTELSSHFSLFSYYYRSKKQATMQNVKDAASAVSEKVKGNK
jgi:hypothetical protein